MRALKSKSEIASLGVEDLIATQESRPHSPVCHHNQGVEFITSTEWKGLTRCDDVVAMWMFSQLSSFYCDRLVLPTYIAPQGLWRGYSFPLQDFVNRGSRGHTTSPLSVETTHVTLLRHKWHVCGLRHLPCRCLNLPITLIVGQWNFFLDNVKWYMSGLHHHYYAALTCWLVLSLLLCWTKKKFFLMDNGQCIFFLVCPTEEVALCGTMKKFF